MNAFRRVKRLFPVDVGNLLVVNIGFFIHRFDIINTEGQDVFVVDGVDNGIGMQLCPKRLLGGF